MQTRPTILLSATFVGLALLSASHAALAQGWIEPRDRWGPTFQVERVRSDVRVTVDGDSRVARVEVEEVFRNRSHGLAEGDYLYPIPSSAVFTNFSLFMGDQELKGEVLSAEEARKIYEEIVRRKKDPALIELVGHGVLRARVFPIEPGDSRRVILRYTQVLGRDGDTLRLRYPRIVGILPGTETREVFLTPTPTGGLSAVHADGSCAKRLSLFYPLLTHPRHRGARAAPGRDGDRPPQRRRQP